MFHGVERILGDIHTTMCKLLEEMRALRALLEQLLADRGA